MLFASFCINAYIILKQPVGDLHNTQHSLTQHPPPGGGKLPLPVQSYGRAR